VHHGARVADELPREAPADGRRHELAVSNCSVTSCASAFAPERDVSTLSNARKTTKPRSTAKPVAMMPNTPAARSPSSK